jgi:hypothetical protein
VIPTKTFTVQIANGKKLKCYGCFEEVWMDLQGTHFSLTLYSLPLTGLDLVLGIQWLEVLGFMVGNWKQVIMEFFWKNQIRRLQGVNDESFKPHQSKNYQKRFSRTMPFLQYAYRSVLRSHTKKCILTCRKSCKSSQNYWRGLLVYRPSEKFITTSPSKKESNQSMPDHTVICTIKKRRSRNKSMVC